jgi:hypothetical protein
VSLGVQLISAEMSIIVAGVLTVLGIFRYQSDEYTYQGRHRLVYEGRHRYDNG